MDCGFRRSPRCRHPGERRDPAFDFRVAGFVHSAAIKAKSNSWIPAFAGMTNRSGWIPAFAGMTSKSTGVAGVAEGDGPGGSLASIYALKGRFQALLRPLVRRLHGAGVTA